MSPEDRDLLLKTYKLAEENNKILLTIRRSTHISLILKISYWVIIIGLSFGAFYFIQPYLEAISGVSSNIKGGAGNIQNTADQLKDLFK